MSEQIHYTVTTVISDGIAQVDLDHQEEYIFGSPTKKLVITITNYDNQIAHQLILQADGIEMVEKEEE